MKTNNLKALWTFEGYVTLEARVALPYLQVTIRRDERYGLPCPDCGRAMAFNRETWNTARDLPCGAAGIAIIKYPAIQGRCASCRKFHTVRPREIDSSVGATRRLMATVNVLARHVPLKDVGQAFGISAASAYRWDMKVLEGGLAEPDLENLRVLLVDEKSVRKRHGYVTLVMNGDTGELLHMAEGKKKESLQGFFDKLSDEQKASIEAVCIDRAGAYKAAIRENLPGAAIVFDKFHLMKNLNEVIDEVRREEYRQASDGEREVFKGQRYNLLRHEENLPLWAVADFRRLLELNENLNICYMLKEAFGLVWSYLQPKRASDYLAQWVAWARQSAVGLMEKFANGVERDAENITSYSKHRITNGRLEGFNNQVARVIHKACGIRNVQYLFLKLRQQSLLQL